MADVKDPPTSDVSVCACCSLLYLLRSIAQNNPKWAGLKGFALLEKYMMDLDQSMVADYNDDINTLLTFVRHHISCR